MYKGEKTTIFTSINQSNSNLNLISIECAGATATGPATATVTVTKTAHAKVCETGKIIAIFLRNFFRVHMGIHTIKRCIKNEI